MTRLPSMTASDVIKKIKKCGFVFDRYAKGSHEIWYNPDTDKQTTINFRRLSRMVTLYNFIKKPQINTD